MLVMISQPMGGHSEEEILETRARAKIHLESLGYEVADTYFSFPNDISKNYPLYCLSKSLEVMANCDVLYMCRGWSDNRGCIIEHDAARAYGIPLLYE